VGVSPHKPYDLRTTGQILGIQISNVWRYRRSELDRTQCAVGTASHKPRDLCRTDTDEVRRQREMAAAVAISGGTTP
jgi:hypothetical protein